jgi:putative DNA primase/helicase
MPPLPDPARLSDSTNAEYMAARYGARLRYDHLRGRWLSWRGHYFLEDPDGEVWRLSKEVARELYRRAPEVRDLKERGRLAKFAIDSEQRSRREAMVSLARSEHPIADKGDDWDSKPLLLACPNGVVELETGRLRDGDPTERLSRHTAVPYDPRAQCPRFRRFLTEVFERNAALIDWMHRFLGYSTTGLTVEQMLAILLGGGSNGKSTLTHAVGYPLGTYYYNAPFATFEASNKQTIPNDLAALERRRFVVSSETNEGTRLNEARIKAITDEAITARYLHQEFFTYRSQMKLWLAVNHLPVVRDDTFGFWRRVRVIQFNRTFPIDKSLETELRGEAQGILTWLVDGCREYLNRGLQPVPSVVLLSTETYKVESDNIASFLSERCTTTDTTTSALSGDLYKAYTRWCVSEGIKKDEVLSNTAFGRRMRDRFKSAHTREGKRYYGVGLCDGYVTGFEAKEEFSNVGAR